jgi:hypothetical protein
VGRSSSRRGVSKRAESRDSRKDERRFAAPIRYVSRLMAALDGIHLIEKLTRASCDAADSARDALRADDIASATIAFEKLASSLQAQGQSCRVLSASCVAAGASLQVQSEERLGRSRERPRTRQRR